MSPMAQNIPVSLGGKLIGGPAAVRIPPGTLPISGLAVFARGTDNALWYNEFFGHTSGVTAGCTRWAGS